VSNSIEDINGQTNNRIWYIFALTGGNNLYDFADNQLIEFRVFIG